MQNGQLKTLDTPCCVLEIIPLITCTSAILATRPQFIYRSPTTITKILLLIAVGLLLSTGAVGQPKGKMSVDQVAKFPLPDADAVEFKEPDMTEEALTAGVELSTPASNSQPSHLIGTSQDSTIERDSQESVTVTFTPPPPTLTGTEVLLASPIIATPGQVVSSITPVHLDQPMDQGRPMQGLLRERSVTSSNSSYTLSSSSGITMSSLSSALQHSPMHRNPWPMYRPRTFPTRQSNHLIQELRLMHVQIMDRIAFEGCKGMAWVLPSPQDYSAMLFKQFAEFWGFLQSFQNSRTNPMELSDSGRQRHPRASIRVPSEEETHNLTTSNKNRQVDKPPSSTDSPGEEPDFKTMRLSTRKESAKGKQTSPTDTVDLPAAMLVGDDPMIQDEFNCAQVLHLHARLMHNLTEETEADRSASPLFSQMELEPAPTQDMLQKLIAVEAWVKATMTNDLLEPIQFLVPHGYTMAPKEVATMSMPRNVSITTEDPIVIDTPTRGSKGARPKKQEKKDPPPPEHDLPRPIPGRPGWFLPSLADVAVMKSDSVDQHFSAAVEEPYYIEPRAPPFERTQRTPFPPRAEQEWEYAALARRPILRTTTDRRALWVGNKTKRRSVHLPATNVSMSCQYQHPIHGDSDHEYWEELVHLPRPFPVKEFYKRNPLPPSEHHRVVSLRESVAATRRTSAAQYWVDAIPAGSENTELHQHRSHPSTRPLLQLHTQVFAQTKTSIPGATSRRGKPATAPPTEDSRRSPGLGSSS